MQFLLKLSVPFPFNNNNVFFALLRSHQWHSCEITNAALDYLLLLQCCKTYARIWPLLTQVSLMICLRSSIFLVVIIMTLICHKYWNFLLEMLGHLNLEVPRIVLEAGLRRKFGGVHCCRQSSFTQRLGTARRTFLAGLATKFKNRHSSRMFIFG